jgi:hypothetical protein
MQEADGYIGDRSEIVENIAEQQEKQYETFIGHMLKAPAFLIDNEYILRGYRINFNTKMKIFKSLFMLHNETVNVWSHLLGVFAIFAYFIYTVSSVYNSFTYQEIYTGDPTFTTNQLNRNEVSLTSHSNASTNTDFGTFSSKYLNQSITGSTIVNDSVAITSLGQYWTNELTQ